MSNQINITNNVEKLIKVYKSNKTNKTIEELRELVNLYSRDYLPLEIITIIFNKMDKEDFKQIILNWRDMPNSNYNPEMFQIGFSLYVNSLIEKDNVIELEIFSEEYSLNLIGIAVIKKLIGAVKECKTLSIENKCIEYIKNKNLNWDKIFDGIKDIVKNDFFTLILNQEDGIILDDIIGNKEFPQWLKDTSLLISAQNLSNKTIQYWLNKGADPQLQSLQKNTFILNHKVLLPDTKIQGSNISGASEARQLIVSYLPEYFKNDSYLHWITWVDIMLSSKNKFVHNEVGLYMLSGDIKPTDTKKYSKYAQCLISLNPEQFDTLLKKYQENNILNNNFNIQLYKFAILNNKGEHLKTLFDNSIDPRPYIKSSICKSIQDNYNNSEAEKYKPPVVKLNNEAINFDLYNKLNDKFSAKITETKKKHKI